MDATYINKKALKKHKGELESLVSNNTECVKCKGQCCKYCGCAFAPNQFPDLSFDTLKTEIDKGKISIMCDYTYKKGKNEPVLFLCARNTNRPIVNLATRPTNCASLTNKGCSFSYENRPIGGKLLLARDGKSIKECTSILDIEYTKTQWAKPETQATLRALVEHYCGQPFDQVHITAIKQFFESERHETTFDQWAYDRLGIYLSDKEYSKYE